MVHFIKKEPEDSLSDGDYSEEEILMEGQLTPFQIQMNDSVLTCLPTQVRLSGNNTVVFFAFKATLEGDSPTLGGRTQVKFSNAEIEFKIPPGINLKLDGKIDYNKLILKTIKIKEE